MTKIKGFAAHFNYHYYHLLIVTATMIYYFCPRGQPTIAKRPPVHWFLNHHLRFHGGREVDLYLYLAQAYFDAGQYSECSQALLKSLHVCPDCLQLWWVIILLPCFIWTPVTSGSYLYWWDEPEYELPPPLYYISLRNVLPGIILLLHKRRLLLPSCRRTRLGSHEQLLMFSVPVMT